MSKYNMSMLVKAASIDAVSAALSFPSREDFWVALTKLSVEAGHFLQGHTPSVVIYDADMREHFIKELNRTRATVKSLHVKRAPEILDTLEQAVANMDVASLSDGLRLFYAEMKILTKEISDAIVPDKKVSANKKSDTPVIMAVDDSHVALKSISDILTGGYRLLTLKDGYSALKVLETHTPDLFLLDIMMPGMSGYQLAKKIRMIERFRKTPIIFTTGMESEKHGLAAMTQGGNDFLKKPLDKIGLLDTIKKYLKK